MHRLLLNFSLVALLFLGLVLVGLGQDQLKIDATKQPSPPARSRGPFPGSASPGHSAGLPIRLDLLIPTGELKSDGTLLVDFSVTNVGSELITLPFSISQGSLLPKPPDTEYTLDVLTLWLTSDAIKGPYLIDINSGLQFKTDMVGTSAELYGRSDDPLSFYSLAPNQSMIVHASSRIQLEPGTHSITAHAELLRESVGLNSQPPDTVNITSKLVGTADSDPQGKMLSTAAPPTR